MSESRHLIEDTLRRHTDDLEFSAPPISRIMSTGTRLRRRRAVAIATGSIAAVTLIVGVGWAATARLGQGGSDAPLIGAPSPDPKVPPTSQSSPESSATPTWPPAGVTLTPCADIPRIPDLGEIDDLTVDVANGILTFNLPTAQGERTVDIAYLRDEQCREHPEVRQLIERVEDDF